MYHFAGKIVEEREREKTRPKIPCQLIVTGSDENGKIREQMESKYIASERK